MADPYNVAPRCRALHPRVSVANGQANGRTVWGVTLDGRYVAHPRCHSIEGALRKAERLSRNVETGRPV